MAHDMDGGSFRDPSGFVYRDAGGVLHRQVNDAYAPHYDRLMESGLYDALVKAGDLVPHEEVDVSKAPAPGAYKLLRPRPVPFVSYPYEWSFSQLKDAASLTLRVQRTALEHGMILKDASAYNVQFEGGRPVFIDTLSFESYEEGTPWIAYRQFCQHFLAPLALMAYTDVRLSQLLRVHVDGVPLDLAAACLPRRARFRFGLLSHVFLHARTQQRYADRDAPARATRMPETALRALVDNLEGTVRKLRWRPEGTEWGDYYADTNYSDAAFDAKKRVVGEFLDAVRPGTVWDLGANTGVFSRLAADRGATTVAFDVDPAAVEQHYLARRDAGDKNGRILPLLLDLSNPSPGLGWAGEERMSLPARGPADTVLALALVHHLAISNNVPLPSVAAYLRTLAPNLVIEFVPKSDSQVQRLLRTREDVFDDYHRDAFEAAFAEHYKIEARRDVDGSERTLYLMRG